MDGKATSENELAWEQGYAFLNEIFRELCQEGHDPEMLYQSYIKGAAKALADWLKEGK